LVEFGVVLEQGLADDWANIGEGEKAFVCVVDELNPPIPVDWGAKRSGLPKLELVKVIITNETQQQNYEIIYIL
jgi:hypothetical protein